ncbi:tRNA uracil 4-sulfurtransferase ThiI [Mycoplasmoides genitalium]|uniref:Probable tRNA sulfurtransferase n=2 Tax=Mycoplasmoides genitalium TaxID=2097 RepID=THII_MYCGE|nr:tRNA uracil 4-sulfurtransferase ThiI [Mycoplasmoides genitalium]P47612.1 RecName: Full=Probable tRNA sulfurtransferase; AltName: Full=Sulfur carrier protein ThiS sulfurtransferase; AltName: Full=Thiamine biosynthesis protein ThiI; AltName: Full=tRNA 4-thiouridine synthase [Mycoplasmoides genitalium G37]ABY79413.1 thiamine biosynthesis/tRNA modification protein ThiI [synthetic Mycoplasma genitalium JCVI-1.0]AAC71599.1 thiamine biosynthesis/tRNA modification protein ThiI [Mycoplasmoides genital
MELNSEDVLVARYGELVLKGKNRSYFTKQLKINIKKAFKKLEINNSIVYEFDRIVVFDIKKEQRAILQELFSFLPGISLFFFASQIVREENKLLDLLFNLFKDFNSFKLEVKRRDKNFAENSSNFKKYLAVKLFEKYQLKGVINNPEIIANIEILKEHFLVFTERFKGKGGLPVYSSGKALVLLSGGIDSPVAASLVMQRGFNIDFITFINEPNKNQKTIEKITRLANLISFNKTICSGKLLVFDFTAIQKELIHISNESYRIVLMRRVFYKAASMFKYDCLVTGEVLGQVASQTIENLKVIQSATPDTFIVRPLIGFSKDKIIELAKFFNTFDISIEQHLDTCSEFSPKNPTTKAKLINVEKLESELIFLNDLIEKGVSELSND